LDPRDTSFNPRLLEDFLDELHDWHVDIPLLEKLLRNFRISLTDDSTEPAFKELKDNSQNFSWFDEKSLKFYDEFEPFESCIEMS